MTALVTIEFRVPLVLLISTIYELRFPSAAEPIQSEQEQDVLAREYFQLQEVYIAFIQTIYSLSMLEMTR